MAAWGEGRLGPQQQPWSREAGGGFSPPLPAAEPQKRRPRDPRTSDSRPPALRTDPPSCWARPWALVWAGPQERGPGRSSPGRAAPPPHPPPPAHLHDRLLLFHVAGAGAWRLLRAGAAAGRSGREHRGVFISARVASSAGEGGVRSPRGGTGLRPHALLPGDRVGWRRGLTARRVCRTGTGSLGARVNYGRAWAGQVGHWRGPGQEGTARPRSASGIAGPTPDRLCGDTGVSTSAEARGQL